MMRPIKHRKTQSSLLIPQRLLDVFYEKTKDIPKEIFFHYLLKKYKGLVMDGLFNQSKKVKTSYQNSGENLVKKNFRPFNPDWIELGIVANYLGFSRTALFTWFLTLELGDLDQILRDNFYEHGVPPKISTIQLKNILSRKNDIIWKRKIYYKIRR